MQVNIALRQVNTAFEQWDFIDCHCTARRMLRKALCVTRRLFLNQNQRQNGIELPASVNQCGRALEVHTVP